jgi:hypothetical protein
VPAAGVILEFTALSSTRALLDGSPEVGDGRPLAPLSALSGVLSRTRGECPSIALPRLRQVPGDAGGRRSRMVLDREPTEVRSGRPLSTSRDGPGRQTSTRRHGPGKRGEQVAAGQRDCRAVSGDAPSQPGHPRSCCSGTSRHRPVAGGAGRDPHFSAACAPGSCASAPGSRCTSARGGPAVVLHREQGESRPVRTGGDQAADHPRPARDQRLAAAGGQEQVAAAHYHPRAVSPVGRGTACR